MFNPRADVQHVCIASPAYIYTLYIYNTLACRGSYIIIYNVSAFPFSNRVATCIYYMVYDIYTTYKWHKCTYVYLLDRGNITRTYNNIMYLCRCSIRTLLSKLKRICNWIAPNTSGTV